ncbi:DNA damage-regulated autophagy modulator protein 1-like [Rhopilema esculentum]|uniref:DNA damage-regulated autophagy modulator protein 1-like n=1 Tax=Rhopilema esculentum TaxID=499914 RepID=UPI0031DC71F3|eukprot:gene13449-4321_t
MIVRKYKIDHCGKGCGRDREADIAVTEKFFFTNQYTMPKQTWNVNMDLKQPDNNRGHERYVVGNQLAVIHNEAENRPRHESALKLDGIVFESGFKRRWKSGNVLIIMLPIGASVLPALFLLAAFFHADDGLILRNNTDVPYISDIGNHKPYSSVFTFGLSVSALFGLWLIIVRYIQVEILYRYTGSKLNFFCFIIGLLSIFGELLVASFQLSSQETVHYLGAFLQFASTFLYMIIQTWISHKHLPSEPRKKQACMVVIIRAMLSVGVFISLLMFGVFLVPSLSHYNRSGYSVAPVAEWTLLVFVILFMLTFLYDFRNLTCRVVVENLLSE